MSSAHRFRFGEDPPAVLAHSTTPLPLLRPASNPEVTAPLTELVPPPDALVFREPPSAWVPSPAPVVPLVPPLPERAPAPSRVSFRTAASLVLLVLEVLVLGYLAATWRP